MATNKTQDRDRSNLPNSPACGQWETLLVDAMDGQLQPEDEATFSNHMANCAACTEMFEQVRRGREWLEFLSPEPEVPLDLLQRILNETGHGKLDLSKMDPGKLAIVGNAGIDVNGNPLATGNLIAMAPVWQRPSFSGHLRRFAEPRLLMTAAMAFFSIALTLSMTGVRISRVSMADLRPASVRSVVEKRIMTASTPLVRYYDHLRFVYEVESRMKELRRSSEQQSAPQGSSQPNSQAPDTNPQSRQPGGDGETHRKDGGSELHPNDAPQQTMIPPFAQWNGDLLDAEIAPAFGPNADQPSGMVMTQSSGLVPRPRSGFMTPTHESEILEFSREAGLAEASAESMPERSKSCSA